MAVMSRGQEGKLRGQECRSMLEHLSKMGEVMGLIPFEREGDGEEERKRQRHGRTPLEDTEAWIMDLPAKIC